MLLSDDVMWWFKLTNTLWSSAIFSLGRLSGTLHAETRTRTDPYGTVRSYRIDFELWRTDSCKVGRRTVGCDA